MDAEAINLFLNSWLGVILDTVLIGAVLLLWLSWFRNGKRQQRLEQMLLEASGQLQEATRHLSEATEAMENLKRHESTRPSSCEPVARAAPVPKQAAPEQPAPTRTSALPAQNSTQATMILRMQREGESAQTIAERLDMPLAQVKLLLKLNTASGSLNTN